MFLEMIPFVMVRKNDNDAVIVMPGKTLCFDIPAKLSKGVTVVVTPVAYGGWIDQCVHQFSRPELMR